MILAVFEEIAGHQDETTYTPIYYYLFFTRFGRSGCDAVIFYFIVIIGSVFGYTLRVFDFTNRVTAACCWEQLAAAAAAAALVRLSFFFVFVRYRLDVHVV